MVYLKSMIFPNADLEFDFILSIKRTCYDSYYPFKILSGHDLHRLDFEPITILVITSYSIHYTKLYERNWIYCKLNRV